MRIILSVVKQRQVVEELLEAMRSSVDIFSQDTSFDFQLVRVDKFLVPPLYVERYDDGCMSYWSKKNVHPSLDDIKKILMRPRGRNPDENTLQYAAVIYRTGKFGNNACWGALFYLAQSVRLGEETEFVRLDCQEKIQFRDEGPVSYNVCGAFWPTPDKVDGFTLAWVLAYANKKVEFVCEERNKNYDTERMVKEFNCFCSGQGQVDALVNKVGFRSHARLPIRHGWAWAALPNSLPSPYEGVGEQLKKLFEESTPV